MPTGYTHRLMDSGEDFKTFALRCAHAFGALIELRDSGVDAPIPDKFKPSDHHVKAFNEAAKKRNTLKAMGAKERAAFGRAERAKAIRSLRAWRKRDLAENARLTAMAAHVHRWQPPSANHTGMKEFMADQIKISLNDTQYVASRIAEASLKNATEYFDEALAATERDIIYHKEGHAKEVERVRERNEWVRLLWESLA